MEFTNYIVRLLLLNQFWDLHHVVKLNDKPVKMNDKPMESFYTSAILFKGFLTHF